MNLSVVSDYTYIEKNYFVCLVNCTTDEDECIKHSQVNIVSFVYYQRNTDSNMLLSHQEGKGHLL